MISISELPTLNAILNGISGILLLTGYWFIRQKKIALHKTCMLGALLISTLFLICYVTYHYQIGSKPFSGEGGIRYLYFSILIPHVILAAVTLPMAIITVKKAWKKQFEEHRRLGKWTLPIWLYVSVTGILIYLMLYQF
tara:strand:+ start:270 stop:686 length:417 start_codon:yes stop_codon:yes gene_type:complete